MNNDYIEKSINYKNNDRQRFVDNKIEIVDIMNIVDSVKLMIAIDIKTVSTVVKNAKRLLLSINKKEVNEFFNRANMT